MQVAAVQFCGTILRVNVIKPLWQPDEDEPAIADAEKAYIRSKLPAMLADASSKIRTAVVRPGAVVICGCRCHAQFAFAAP